MPKKKNAENVVAETPVEQPVQEQDPGRISFDEIKASAQAVRDILTAHGAGPNITVVISTESIVVKNDLAIIPWTEGK